ncbi:hypothetical protein [Pseudomonas sp.]|uniref:hypothetical protein n=1 Tax=Pseudomonas sp. TaxID=306 RepID=UPI003C5E3355
MTNISSSPIAPGFFSYGVELAALLAQKVPPQARAPSPGAEDDGLRASPPDSLETRAKADAQVQKAFAKALLARFHQTTVSPPHVHVPPESTLGRWRTLFDSALRSPGVVAWAKDQGLDTTALKLNPSRGEITGIVGGKEQTFSLDDDSGWAEVSRALLATAKALAPEPGQTLNCPLPSGDLPWAVVGKFYHFPFDMGPAQVAKYRKQLVSDPNFEFPPLPFASLRSPSALVEQETVMGDEVDCQSLITVLQDQANAGEVDIDLSKVWVPIHPRSSYSQSLDEPAKEARAVDLIEAYAMLVPQNVTQARNMLLMLSFDLHHRAPDSDRGCALPLTRLLETTTLGPGLQSHIREIVERWKMQDPVQASLDQAGPGATSLMGRLLHHLPEDTRKAISTHPAKALDELIRSPHAKALGKKIQEELGRDETSTSDIEFVSAALALDLDPWGGASRHNVAGYAPYGKENIGFSPAQIVSRFTRHLEGRIGTEMAPIAARLLLSVSAPEFLAKAIPPNLVYGSHTWAQFSIEAWRIEKKVPGAVANMTFSQVMLFAQTEPVSREGQDQLDEVKRLPITDWGVANGVIRARPDNIYSKKDYDVSEKAVLLQYKDVAWASEVLKTPAPNRREMALGELKRVFGGNLDFEKKVIKDDHEVWPDITLYSLLDIYMSGHLSEKVWVSTDEKALPYNSMRRELGKLEANIPATFDNAFDKFKAQRAEAMDISFRYHLSLMPVADREILNTSIISFFELRKPYDKRVKSKLGNHETLKYVSDKPSAEDVKNLTGTFGLIIQADRGNGDIHHYSYFPGQAKIIKESALGKKPLVSQPQKEWQSPDINGAPRNATGEALNIDANPYFGLPAQGSRPDLRLLVERVGEPNTDRLSAKIPSDTAEGLSGDYFSKRTLAMGATVGKHFTRDLERERAEEKDVTQREQEIKTNRKLDELFLSLVPFYDGVRIAMKGDVSGAVLELGFDAVGFLLPGGKALGTAVRTGRGALKAIGGGVVKGINGSLGLNDFFKLGNNISTGFNTAGKLGNSVLYAVQKRVPLGIKAFDPKKVYRHKDVVSDFYYKVVGSSTPMGPVAAIFLNGGWYAYNFVTKVPQGVQLVQYAMAEAFKD